MTVGPRRLATSSSVNAAIEVTKKRPLTVDRFNRGHADPDDLLDIIESKGREVDAAIASLREMLRGR